MSLGKKITACFYLPLTEIYHMLQFLPSTANLGGINNTCASLSIEIRCFHITFQLSPTSWNVFTLTTTLKLNQLLDICIKACYLTNLYRSIHTNIPMFLSHKFSVSISHEFNSILITHYQETWFPLCLCILFVISLKNPLFWEEVQGRHQLQKGVPDTKWTPAPKELRQWWGGQQRD